METVVKVTEHDNILPLVNMEPNTEFTTSHTSYYEPGKWPKAEKKHDNDYPVTTKGSVTLWEILEKKSDINIISLFEKIEATNINFGTLYDALSFGNSRVIVMKMKDKETWSLYGKETLSRETFVKYLGHTVWKQLWTPRWAKVFAEPYIVYSDANTNAKDSLTEALDLDRINHTNDRVE